MVHFHNKFFCFGQWHSYRLFSKLKGLGAWGTFSNPFVRDCNRGVQLAFKEGNGWRFFYWVVKRREGVKLAIANERGAFWNQVIIRKYGKERGGWCS